MPTPHHSIVTGRMLFHVTVTNGVKVLKAGKINETEQKITTDCHIKSGPSPSE